MGEDYHGLINIPVPRSARYEGSGRQGSVNLGRLQAGSGHGPAAVYGLAMGGPGLAKGLEAAGDELHRQELERQGIEAIEEMTAFQDLERQKLAEISQMTGSAGAGSFSAAENFYRQAGADLIGKARGDYQRKVYEKFVASQSDAGKNYALNHQLKQHEVHKGQVYEGMQGKMDGLIAADPGNFQQYTAQQKKNLRMMYPDAAPEWLAVKGDAIDSAGYQSAFDAAVASGDFQRAEDIARRYFEARPEAVDSGQPANPPKASEPYIGLANEAANTYGVPTNVVLAVMQTESNFGAGAVSHTGVKGLMQVTQQTYKDLGFTGDRSDPRNSTMAGAKLLSQLHQQYGNWEDAFTAYNSGDGGVQYLKTGRWPQSSLDHFAKHGINVAQKSREAKDYAPTVMRNLSAMGEIVEAESEQAGQPAKPVQLASLGPEIAASASDAYGLAGGSEADEFVADPFAANAEGKPPAGPAYGGLATLDQIRKMQTTLDKAKAAQIRQKQETVINHLEQMDLDGNLTNKDVWSFREVLDHDSMIRFFKMADGEAGYQGMVKKSEKEAKLNEFYTAAGLALIPPTRAGLDHWLNTNDANDFFDRKDYQSALKYLEEQDGRLEKEIKNFMDLTGDFSDKKNANKAFIFKARALAIAHKRKLTYDSERLPDTLSYLKHNDNYLKPDPELAFSADYSRGQSAVRQDLRNMIIKQSGLPDTKINQERANEAIEKGKPFHEVMAPDSSLWSGKGLVTLKYRNGNVMAVDSLFERAGNSYNVDPDLLAALAMVVSGGERFAVNRLAPGAVGIMQVPAELMAGTNVDHKYDQRTNILAAAEHLSGLIDEADGDIRRAVELYATSGGMPEEHVPRFAQAVMRYYSNNFGMIPAGPKGPAYGLDHYYQLPDYKMTTSNTERNDQIKSEQLQGTGRRNNRIPPRPFLFSK